MAVTYRIEFHDYGEETFRRIGWTESLEAALMMFGEAVRHGAARLTVSDYSHAHGTTTKEIATWGP